MDDFYDIPQLFYEILFFLQPLPFIKKLRNVIKIINEPFHNFSTSVNAPEYSFQPTAILLA